MPSSASTAVAGDGRQLVSARPGDDCAFLDCVKELLLRLNAGGWARVRQNTERLHRVGMGMLMSHLEWTVNLAAPIGAKLQRAVHRHIELAMSQQVL